MDDLIRQEVSLAPYSTLRVGGSAAYLAEVTSIAELQEVLSFAKQHTNVPPLVIGFGYHQLLVTFRAQQCHCLGIHGGSGNRGCRQEQDESSSQTKPFHG